MEEDRICMARRAGEVGNPAAGRDSADKDGVYTWSVWQSRGVWMEYDPLICAVIEAAFVKGQNTVCSSQDHVSDCEGGSHVMLQLATALQGIRYPRLVCPLQGLFHAFSKPCTPPP